MDFRLVFLGFLAVQLTSGRAGAENNVLPHGNAAARTTQEATTRKPPAYLAAQSKSIVTLTADLGDRSFAVRDAASRELLSRTNPESRTLKKDLEEVAKALQGDSAEAQIRAKAIVDRYPMGKLDFGQFFQRLNTTIWMLPQVEYIYLQSSCFLSYLQKTDQLDSLKEIMGAQRNLIATPENGKTQLATLAKMAREIFSGFAKDRGLWIKYRPGHILSADFEDPRSGRKFIVFYDELDSQIHFKGPPIDRRELVESVFNDPYVRFSEKPIIKDRSFRPIESEVQLSLEEPEQIRFGKAIIPFDFEGLMEPGYFKTNSWPDNLFFWNSSNFFNRRTPNR